MLKTATSIWPLAIWGVVACYGASKGEISSLSESNIESKERDVVVSIATAKRDDFRSPPSPESESVKALTDELVESNAEAELFRREYSDLRLRMEALGLESADEDRAKLEQRLLHAVSDLRLSRQECERYRDLLLGLMEKVVHFLKMAQRDDAQARMEVEEELRRINDLIEKPVAARPVQPTLMNGSVVGVKEEWSLVVTNLGEQQGVRMGMPLRVVRGDHLVATLRVVDVRQRICGAVIQELGSDREKIRVGDHLEVDARTNVILK